MALGVIIILAVVVIAVVAAVIIAFLPTNHVSYEYNNDWIFTFNNRFLPTTATLDFKVREGSGNNYSTTIDLPSGTSYYNSFGVGLTDDTYYILTITYGSSSKQFIDNNFRTPVNDWILNSLEPDNQLAYLMAQKGDLVPITETEFDRFGGFSYTGGISKLGFNSTPSDKLKNASYVVADQWTLFSEHIMFSLKFKAFSDSEKFNFQIVYIPDDNINLNSSQVSFNLKVPIAVQAGQIYYFAIKGADTRTISDSYPVFWTTSDAPIGITNYSNDGFYTSITDTTQAYPQNINFTKINDTQSPMVSYSFTGDISWVIQ